MNKIDLNTIEEVKWEICIQVIDHYLVAWEPADTKRGDFLRELKKELKQFLKEQE